MLEHIERANLFIAPLDNKRVWYRYHSLFSEMLQHRLKLCGKKSVHELHKKASLWFVKAGYFEEAFQHGFNTNDMYFAAELLESNILSLLTSYEWAAARRWFEKIPREILEQRFMLGLGNAFLLFLQEEFTDTDKTITNLDKTIARATKQYPADKRRYAQDLFLALKVSCLFYKDFAQVLPAAKIALKKIAPKNKIALWLVQAVLSDAYTQQGDIQPALEHVKTSLSYFKHSAPKERVYIKFHLINKQAGLERLHGRLKNAEKLLKDAFEYAREAGISLRPAMAMLNVTLAQVYYSQNRLKEALDHAEECIKYTKPVSDIGFLLLGYRMKAFVHQVLGKSGLAKEVMDEALATAHQTKSAIRIASTELSAVRLALMQSDLKAVSKWAKQRRLNVNEPFSSNFEEECLTLALYHMAEKKFETASDILTALYPRTHKRKRCYSTLRINIIRAGVLYALGEQESALGIMENCTEFASQEGIVRPFADNAVYISKLLLSLRKSEKGMVRIYVSKLLKEIELDRVSISRRQQCLLRLTDPLSQREIEILQLIVIGLTNKEIADNICVSLNTVKTHIRNIYGKLCVANREQAILRAQEINII
jgi:LuxR family maltose regulon positive regulatory protein